MNAQEKIAATLEEVKDLQSTFDPYVAGQEMFFSPRQEDDIDFVAIVREELKSSGVPEEVLETQYDNHRWIVGSKDRIPLVQRTFINNYLNVTLGRSPRDTMDLRRDILPTSSDDIWLKLVKERVIPFLAEGRVLEI